MAGSRLGSMTLCAPLAVGGCGIPPRDAPPQPAAVAPHAASAEVRTTPDPSDRVIAALRPVLDVKGATPRRFTLAERMQHYHVPGVSVAVVDDGRIAWARGFGVKRAGDAAPVTEDTMFQAASISKVVTATVTLRLADQGKLSLDADVNGALRSWHVPENEFTKTEKVTLRRILSHSAGLTGHTVGGYGPNEPLPTLPQILDGKKPAKTEPVRVDVTPGSIARYSGGGVTIEQLLLTDVAGKPFAALAQELVLDPIGMRHSSFETVLSDRFAPLAASPHSAAGRPIPGWKYQEVAAAGLWTTPADLLSWALAIVAARDGAPGAVLARPLATDMLTIQKAPFGLGPVLEGSGRAFHFSHQGWNEGFHSELVFFPEAKQGAAVMVNGDAGRPMVREILYAIAAEYGWPDFAPTPIEPIPTTDRDLEKMPGAYLAEKPERVVATVRREGRALVLDASRLGVPTELAFLGPESVIALDTGDRFALIRGADGRVMALDFGIVKLDRVPASPTGTGSSAPP